MKLRVIRLLICICAGILSVVVYGCGFLNIDDNFDSEVWKAQSGFHENKNPRNGMVVSLKKYHLFEGMMQVEVYALLGEPDSKRNSKDVYYLGVSPWGIDFEYLELEYDSELMLVRINTTQG
jgi:hypothetical protein